MGDFVELEWKRNWGWPWPEDSWGLTPRFGEDGWCRSCGVPQRAQSGSLVLRKKGKTGPPAAWVPNWQFDVVCLERSLAEEIGAKFDIELCEVAWHGSGGADAMQIVAPWTEQPWFDHDELRAAAEQRHGVAGKTCPDCGAWRWMPLGFGVGLPPLRLDHAGQGKDVIASPEWFGDGWNAFRQLLFRRELAELIVAACPREVKINDVL
ncbi:hypothetical protein ACIA8G_18080 [Lentzea sp. NPDC051213]|uniref:hypothetical protein n=1 Tax=Lentzea sp. NPDC051213 TaxID=3364126 RepID=UPI0037999045